jgi:hypothetical protein
MNDQKSRPTLAIVMALAAVSAAIVTVFTPATAAADACADAATNAPLPLEFGPCAAVLVQETRWLAAITAGDVATVESILAPDFRSRTAR